MESGTALLIRSVDLRGNTDDSWRRAADRLVRDVLDRELDRQLSGTDAPH